MLIADLARTLQQNARANGGDDDDGVNGGEDQGVFGAGELIDDSGEQGTASIERQYFGLALDMNEVLVSHIHDAAARDNAKELKKLIEGDKSLLNRQDNAGNTPAHWAAGAGALSTLRYLLQCECDLTLKNALGDTPLHRAVWRNQTGAVRLLIDEGNIDLSIRNNASLLAIDLARQEEIHTMLRALVDLASVSHHMLVDEDDVSIHSSSDVDDEEGDDEHANIVFESADHHSQSADALADADDDVDNLDDETIIIVQEDDKHLGQNSKILKIGHRKLAQGTTAAASISSSSSSSSSSATAPPPVPSRQGRRPLTADADAKDDNQSRFADAEADVEFQDALPPLEEVKK